MSDELVTLRTTGLVDAEARVDDQPTAEAVTLPYSLSLPTRYYGRLALGETAKEFAALADVEWKVGDGAIQLTFTRLDPQAGEVIGEFLNYALYASAVAGPEYTR